MKDHLRHQPNAAMGVCHPNTASCWIRLLVGIEDVCIVYILECLIQDGAAVVCNQRVAIDDHR